MKRKREAAGTRRNRNLVLVGFMGTGKTEVGRALAKRLRREFVDMDEEIARLAGKSVREIFQQDGEAAFRRMERARVRELAARPGRVIAAGGGVGLDPRNLRDLRRTGRLVRLDAPEEEIVERLRGDGGRPLLRGGSERRIRQMYRARRGLYRSVGVRIDTAGLTPAEAARETLRRLAAAGRTPRGAGKEKRGSDFTGARGSDTFAPDTNRKARTDRNK